MSPYEALKTIYLAEHPGERGATVISSIEDTLTDEGERVAYLRKKMTDEEEGRARMAQEAESQRAWREGRPQHTLAPAAAPQTAPAGSQGQEQPEVALDASPEAGTSRLEEIRRLTRSRLPNLLKTSVLLVWIAFLAHAKRNRRKRMSYRDLMWLTGLSMDSVWKAVEELTEDHFRAVTIVRRGRATGSTGKRRVAVYGVEPVTPARIERWEALADERSGEQSVPSQEESAEPAA